MPPATNAEFWESKISGNVERDLDNTRHLQKLGWTVLRFWEHEVKAAPDECAERVLSMLENSASEAC